MILDSLQKPRIWLLGKYLSINSAPLISIYFSSPVLYTASLTLNVEYFTFVFKIFRFKKFISSTIGETRLKYFH